MKENFKINDVVKAVQEQYGVADTDVECDVIEMGGVTYTSMLIDTADINVEVREDCVHVRDVSWWHIATVNYSDCVNVKHLLSKTAEVFEKLSLLKTVFENYEGKCCDEISPKYKGRLQVETLCSASEKWLEVDYIENGVGKFKTRDVVEVIKKKYNIFDPSLIVDRTQEWGLDEERIEIKIKQDFHIITTPYCVYVNGFSAWHCVMVKHEGCTDIDSFIDKIANAVSDIEVMDEFFKNYLESYKKVLSEHDSLEIGCLDYIGWYNHEEFID